MPIGRDPDDNDWETDFLKRQTQTFAQTGYQFPALVARIATASEFFRVVFPAAPAEPAAPKTIAQADGLAPGGSK